MVKLVCALIEVDVRPPRLSHVNTAAELSVWTLSSVLLSQLREVLEFERDGGAMMSSVCLPGSSPQGGRKMCGGAFSSSCI